MIRIIDRVKHVFTKIDRETCCHSHLGAIGSKNLIFCRDVKFAKQVVENNGLKKHFFFDVSN